MTDTLITPMRALRRLAEVGDSAAIAEHLRAAGIYGRQDDAHWCPIARYLTQKTGAWVLVDNETTVWERHRTVRIPMPTQVRLFVEEFDSDVYPFLDVNYTEEGDE